MACADKATYALSPFPEVTLFLLGRRLGAQTWWLGVCPVETTLLVWSQVGRDAGVG